jgi:hypothetical protein
VRSAGAGAVPRQGEQRRVTDLGGFHADGQCFADMGINGSFEAGAHRDPQFDERAGLLIKGSGLMNGASQCIISLGNRWILLDKVLESLRWFLAVSVPWWSGIPL